jgi:hypothetical protein
MLAESRSKASEDAYPSRPESHGKRLEIVMGIGQFRTSFPIAQRLGISLKEDVEVLHQGMDVTE